MKHLSVTVEESTLERIDELKEERDESRSQVVRDLLSKGQRADELEKELNTLRQRLETREARIEELEQQLTRRSQIEEKVEEVALEVREERAESNAPFFVKWYRWFRD
ncbi:ribbon-helix-helix protein, CopG family [Haloglomus irregulare]|nr:ribbon-helix-helix protein, CopG family [Haloglomus irregulare]